MNSVNIMKTRLPQLFTLFAGAVLLLAANGHSQGVPAPAPLPAPGAVDPTTGLPIRPSAPELIAFSNAVEKMRVEANFDAIPLSEVVQWLWKTFPEVNFVLPQSVADLNPPVSLRLRAVGLRDILEAINIATDGAVGYEVRSSTLVAFLSRAGAAFGGGGYGAGYGVGFAGQALPGVAIEPPPTYQVMNLREVLRLKDPEAIRRTLDTIKEITGRTLEIMAADSPGSRPSQPIKSFDYHEGSGVLVIIGQPTAIKVAMDVIRNLRTQDSGGGGGNTGGAEPAEKQPATKASTGDAK